MTIGWFKRHVHEWEETARVHVPPSANKAECTGTEETYPTCDGTVGAPHLHPSPVQRMRGRGTPNLNRVGREIMTAEELVCELFIRQGYAAIQTFHEHKVGDFLNDNQSGTVMGPCAIPIRVVGLSTKEEFYRQCLLAAEITGDSTAVSGHSIPGMNFYRVEAVD